MVWNLRIIGDMDDRNYDSENIPRDGVVYLMSENEQNNCVVWVRRNWESGFDIRITDYKKGQFSIARISSDLYSIGEYIALGHKVCDEDDFNNAMIEASRWILYNTAEKV